MGIWMLTTLVLTRGYAGTLMSLLAVRHVRQPYHTLMDVLDDPEVIQIWQKNSANEQLLRLQSPNSQHSPSRGYQDAVSSLRLKLRTKGVVVQVDKKTPQ
ncbi:hypothetical protein Pmani_018126 [Petrolisthes manimaculis]|uniref:Uncharacterized protein n=1 Tax=Petrolisthes manimaculis TaxID=1843537 RepID=A0AAE1U555_9EUCA|nr:hypothetical protein Pmani_018126 [Petrolisthes manimaculis]